MGVRVHHLKISNLFFKNYSYLILDDASQTALIVDPAWQKKIIDQTLHQYDVTLAAVLLTHSHFDHGNLTSHLVDKYNCVVTMSKIEIDYYDFRSPNLLAIEDFTSFSLGGTQILPILTPGHTKGSLCYLIEDNLFTGDTLFSEGCWLCWGKGADPYAMYDSIQYLKRVLKISTRIYPGHSYGEKPGQTFGKLMKNNIYLLTKDRDFFVKFRMRDNQTGLFRFS